MLKLAYEEYSLKAAESKTSDEVQTMKSSVATLARQLVMQQLFVEERVRSDGDSGIKQVIRITIRISNRYGNSWLLLGNF